MLLNPRHCACVYYQDWHRTQRPKVAAEGGILPGVSRGVSPLPLATDGNSSAYNSPRNTLSSGSGVFAENDASSQPSFPASQAPTAPTPQSTGLPFDEEAKLVYGVVLSLRNMIRKLSGRYKHLMPALHPLLTENKEISSLLAIARQHTSCISTRRNQGTNSSCSVTQTQIPFDSSCVKSTWLHSLNTLSATHSSPWTPESTAWTMSTSGPVSTGLFEVCPSSLEIVNFAKA